MLGQVFLFWPHTHTLDDMKPCTDPMIDHNHSDVFGRRLSDGLPKNKTGGLIFGSLGGSSGGGVLFFGGAYFFWGGLGLKVRPRDGVGVG